MRLDTEVQGLEAVLKPYLVELLKQMWRLAKKARSAARSGWNSSTAHRFAKDNCLTVNGFDPEGKVVSRASIIYGFNDLVDEGILDYHDRTGKGGHQRVYYPLVNPKEFELYVRAKVEYALRENIFSDGWVKAIYEGVRA